MSTPSAKRRVENGALMLDRLLPGWELEIKMPDLDMASQRFCILGQLYGDYFDGLNEVNLDANAAEDYGFVIGIDEDSDRYDLLKKRWGEEIKRRAER
jgi:hypothetical protein